MSPVHVLDSFYLVITLLVTIAYQLLGFAIAWTFQFDKITDFTGGSNFFLLALLTLLLGGTLVHTASATFHARNIVASVLVMVWAARLAGFLFFRVLKTGRDTRFDDIRSHFFKFLGFWIVQIIWVWVVCLPVTIINSPAVSDPRSEGSLPSFGTARDIVGIILWGIGWLIESIADVQKFRAKASASKKYPVNRGLWAWSRHPSYFGEMLCWWGIWALCLSPTTNGSLRSSAQAAQKGAVASPILTMILLLFISGIPTAEKPQAKKFYLLTYGRNSEEQYANTWSEYQAYLRRTSILIPLPPGVYNRFPSILKRTLLMDFPMYKFDERIDGQAAIKADSQEAA